MSPTIVPIVVVGVVLVVLAGVLVAAIAIQRGPDPDEIAVAYELAWDRFDFAMVHALSGRELLDGRTAVQYVEAQQALYAPNPHMRDLVDRVVVESTAVAGGRARVRTRLELRDGVSVLHDDLRLVRRGGRWEVVSYRLDRSVPNLAAPNLEVSNLTAPSLEQVVTSD